MICANNLTKKFDDFLAVDKINLGVKRGQVLVLLGPNGAGKTTTIRMLSSILKPSGGSATVAGYDVIEHPDKVRSSVGVLTEHHGLYNRMKAEEYLQFFGGLYGLNKGDITKKIHMLLEKYGLGADGDRKLGEFSKGMRQKLSLVRALLHDPPVLLFDEPTSAMDPESAFIVRESINDLRSNDRAILICTHNLLEAEELADRVAIIQRGKIIMDNPLPDIKRELMGMPRYKITFVNYLDDHYSVFPEGVSLIEKGDRWLTLSVKKPEKMNPILIKQMSEAGLEILTLQEVIPGLEEAYLNILNKNRNEIGTH